MPAGIVKLKGKWYVLITLYDVHHRGEAEEIVAHKLANKHHPVRVFPFKSWGEAVVYGNALADEFLDDWSMRAYTAVAKPEAKTSSATKEKRKEVAPKVVPHWKDKLKGVKAKPSVTVVVKKRRKLEK